jgi:hypothetical protein
VKGALDSLSTVYLNNLGNMLGTVGVVNGDVRDFEVVERAVRDVKSAGVVINYTD